MRKIVSSIISALACLTVSGQELNAVQNMIVGGDSLEQRRLVFEEFDIEGKDHTWSLENMKPYEKKFRSKYLERKDTVIGRELCSRMIYEQSKEGLRVVAMEDHLSRMIYDMPEEWLRFPMRQGDSINGYFNSTGIYCDRMFMRRFGNYQTKADSVGKLILPNGGTLYGVIRLHTIRQIGTVYADKDTLRGIVPKFTTDSIVRHMAKDTLKMREDIYRWYAEGYRYPVLEAKITSIKDKPIEQMLFYCIPEEQELLASNEVNKAVRDAVARSGEATQKEGEMAQARSENMFAYEISQNDNSITIYYQAEGNLRIIALLASNQGYVYQRQERKGAIGSDQISLSTNGLHKGQYVVYLNVNGQPYAEKVNVAK